MPKRRPQQKLLFLQLPRVENDTAAGENLPMAPRYLFHAAERAGLSSKYEPRGLTHEEEELDDRHLLEKILDWQPDIVCCTLYLWNIERTLHLLRRVRQALVGMKVIVGGPEVGLAVQGGQCSVSSDPPPPGHRSSHRGEGLENAS